LQNITIKSVDNKEREKNLWSLQKIVCNQSESEIIVLNLIFNIVLRMKYNNDIKTEKKTQVFVRSKTRTITSIFIDSVLTF